MPKVLLIPLGERRAPHHRGGRLSAVRKSHPQQSLVDVLGGVMPAALAQWTSRPGATVTNAGHAFLLIGRPPASSPSVRPDLGRGVAGSPAADGPATGRLRLVPRTGEPRGNRSRTGYSKPVTGDVPGAGSGCGSWWWVTVAPGFSWRG